MKKHLFIYLLAFIASHGLQAQNAGELRYLNLVLPDNTVVSYALTDAVDIHFEDSIMVVNDLGIYMEDGVKYYFSVEGGDTLGQSSLFSPGWNWWSTYMEADDLLEQLEAGLGTNGQQIKSQTQFALNYGGMWMGQLQSVDNESCYLVNASGPCVVEITGQPAVAANHPITIHPNWNWIGYPNTGVLSVANAFGSFSPANGDQVKSQNAFATYYGNMWIGGLNTITPGMGLLYKSNNSGSVTLVYPEANRYEEWAENPTSDNNHWKADYHAYPNNMTVMAVVELDDVELRGDNYEIAAFANGECRGSARLMYVEPIGRYIAFLTIVGDEASELRFKLYNAELGTVMETLHATSLQYETNATVGSLTEPYVVRFSSSTGIGEEPESHIAGGKLYVSFARKS